MTNLVFIKKGAFLSFLFLSLMVGACGSDDSTPADPTDPEEPASPEVETLVESLVANDALVIDSQGNIYASDFGTYSPTGGAGTKVLKITREGVVSEFLTGLSGPLSMAFDADDNFYVIDDNNGTDGDILKVTPDGTRTTFATISGWPAGLAFDASGNLYVANYFEPRVTVIAPDGSASTFVEDSKLSGVVGIDFDDAGNLVAGNYNNGRILSVTPAGEVSIIAEISGVVSGFGIGYITHYDGSIYATGIGNHRVYKVDLDGTVATFAGNGTDARVDGPLSSASFRNPNGIVADDAINTIYILDWGVNALRKIDLSE